MTRKILEKLIVKSSQLSIFPLLSFFSPLAFLLCIYVYMYLILYFISEYRVTCKNSSRIKLRECTDGYEKAIP